MALRCILRTIVIFQLQQLIDAASLTSNEKLKPFIQSDTHGRDGFYKDYNTLQNSKNYQQSYKTNSLYTILPLTQKRRPIPTSKTNARNQNDISRKYWSTEHKRNHEQLMIDYDVTTLQSSLYEDDPNPFEFKTNVDGYQVKVISAHKSDNKEDFSPENFKTGHEIEIVSSKSKNKESFSNEFNSNLVLKKQAMEDFSSNSLEHSGEFSEHLLEKDFPSEISSTTDLEEEIDPDVSDEEAMNPEGEKAGRVLEIFSRSNSSTCTTPSGDKGNCRRLTECLLSDALSNFSLFLQYLCMMRGPAVGICCPNNPVIEISDGDDPVDNTTQELKQPKEGCGRNSNTRIVGGSMSVPHEWTWMVALMRRSRFYCGGVIINDWYVLTAAHCVLGIKVKDLTVRLGEYNFMENNEHQRDLPVAEIKRHAQFVTMTFQHDIALLKLKRKVEYSKFVGSICLPDKNGFDYAEVNATVVGWGTVSFGGAASPVLRQVTIPVWSNADCDKTYVLESITDSFMCAGSPKNGEDACQGDSGGPLMALNDNKTWEVIGIVSWGRRCGDPTYPGVYTRVTTYMDWINENMQ